MGKTWDPSVGLIWDAGDNLIWDAADEEDDGVSTLTRSLLRTQAAELKSMMRTQAAQLETIAMRHEKKMADHTREFREAGNVGELSTEKELYELLGAAGDLPVIVNFFAPWCRTCMALRPKYINLARMYGNRVVCVEMSVSNADVKEVIKDRMGVNHIPTCQVWNNKELVDQYVAGTSIDTVAKALA